MTSTTNLAVPVYHAIGRALALALACAVVLAPLASHAAKTSVVTKLSGSAPEVHVSADGDWLALWVEGPSGSFTLTVVDAGSGSQQQVTKSDHPGGMCWIPRVGQLFYCVGAPIEQIGSTRVIYYVYDPEAQSNTKIIHVDDIMPDVDENTSVEIDPEQISVTSPGSYTINPLAAFDGSVVFHMTRNFILPSFNLYYPSQGVMNPKAEDANIGADYDLSNDGTMLYWPLSDEDGNIYIVGYDLEQMKETWHVMYEAAMLTYPADGGMLLKIDSANERAAMLAWSEQVPRLQLYVFGWNEPGEYRVKPFPLLLESGEVIQHFGWKSNSGKLYAVVANTNTGTTALELIDPIFGLREQLVWGTDTFSYVDYAPGTKTYYYCVVDNTDRTPRTAIVRVGE